MVAGIAAAGTATPNLLLHLGLHNIIRDDRDRAIVRGRAYPRRVLRGQAAVRTQPDNRSGSFRDLLTDADGFIGVSTGNLVRQEDWAVTAPGAIAFLMAHPPPEVALQPASPLVLVIATGRFDDPNQVNNLPGIPGLFRGVPNCRAYDDDGHESRSLQRVGVGGRGQRNRSSVYHSRGILSSGGREGGSGCRVRRVRPPGSVGTL